MKRYRKDKTEVIICTSEEVEKLLQEMTTERGYFPEYEAKPVIVPRRMYGVCLVRKKNLYDWYMVSAATLVKWFMDGLLEPAD